MGADPVRFRDAEQRLWSSVGVTPHDRRIHLDRHDCTVRVQECGDGPPVVFVHGASNAGASWAPLVAHLHGVRCVLVDRPGCGLSDPVTAPPNGLDAIGRYADTLIPDLLDALGLDSAPLVMTSYGGYFGLRAAAAAPARIDRMMQFGWVVGAPMRAAPLAMRLGSASSIGWLMARVPPPKPAVRIMLRQIGLAQALDSGRFSDELLDWFVALLRHTHTTRHELRASPRLMSVRHGIDERVVLDADLLQRITAPVSIIWGDADPNGGGDLARRYADALPHAELDIRPGVGHAPWIDEPERSAQRLLAFLTASED